MCFTSLCTNSVTAFTVSRTVSLMIACVGVVFILRNITIELCQGDLSAVRDDSIPKIRGDEIIVGVVRRRFHCERV